MIKGLSPTVHAENILSGMRIAHARIMPNAHLLSRNTDADNPEVFHFGTTRFITSDEAKEILINTFVRPRQSDDGSVAHQPIILIGNAVQNLLSHINDSLGIDLLHLGTIFKAIDTQALAKDAFTHGPRGPNISLGHLLEYFKIRMPNLYNAGNEAVGALLAAVLTSLRDDIYMFGIPQAMVVGRDIPLLIMSWR